MLQTVERRFKVVIEVELNFIRTYADGEVEELVILHQRRHHSGELPVPQITSNGRLVTRVVHHNEADQNAGHAGEDRVLHVTARVLNHWKAEGD